nr:ALPV-213 [Albatrosspox virus]
MVDNHRVFLYLYQIMTYLIFNKVKIDLYYLSNVKLRTSIK